jgi:hypothetical protein
VLPAATRTAGRPSQACRHAWPNPTTIPSPVTRTRTDLAISIPAGQRALNRDVLGQPPFGPGGMPGGGAVVIVRVG